jgi:hypothetical protein
MRIGQKMRGKDVTFASGFSGELRHDPSKTTVLYTVELVAPPDPGSYVAEFKVGDRTIATAKVQVARPLRAK